MTKRALKSRIDITSRSIFPLIFIMMLAAILRFYQLGQNPPSLNWDEVSNGYNAYSILKTQKDEYGNFLPLTFRAFGDYNPALSVYLLVPSIATFGLNEFAVRFPSALLGTFTVLLTYFLTKKLFEVNARSPAARHPSFISSKIGNWKGLVRFREVEIGNSETIALCAMFLLSISPWHLQFSRYDHEANFMLFFAILGITLFLYSFKNYKLLLASSVSFGLALNTYHGAKIWIPLFLLCILFWYRKEISNFGRKLFWPLLILIISTLPIILNFQKSLIRGQSVGVLSRSKPIETFISGYLAHFSPNFLFISGDSIGRHSTNGMGQLYVFELPLILVGLIALLKHRTRSTKFLLTWLLFAPIPAALATPTPHALRSITFLPIESIVAAYGVFMIATSKIAPRLKISIILILVSVAFYNIVTYLHLYYKHEPKLKSPDWSDGYKQMVTYVDTIKDNYQTIAISNYYGRPYIFVLFYSKYDPKKYHSQAENKDSFDKFEFFGPSWEKTKAGLALVVTPPWQAHPPDVLKNVFSTNGNLTFTISQTK